VTSAWLIVSLSVAPATVGEWFVDLLLGWWLFLQRVLPRMTFDTAALIVGCGALILLFVAVHVVGRSAAKRFWPQRTWRVKWTFASVGLLFLMFVAGTALIGITHQVTWLATSKEPLSQQVYADYRPSYVPHGVTDATRQYRWQEIGMGIANSADVRSTLPAGGTFDEQGQGQHSWESYILVFVNYQNPIDFKRPWRDPKNEHHFRSVLDIFINPSFRDEPVRNPDGLGLSHYASNVRVMGPNTAVKLEEITDGTTNTVLYGEVNTGFRPWGDPVNWRDPAVGLGATPETFGGTTDDGVHFAMADGSVRFFSQKTSPEVLKSIATPAAGD